MNLERFKYPPQPHYTVREMCIDYSRERLVAKGKDARHAWTGFNHFMEVDGPRAPKSDATKLTEADIEDYIDARLAKGIVPQTVARELVFVRAAFRNAERRNRIPKALNFELPSGEVIFRRPLTDEEFQLVMSKPMSERLTHF